MKTLFPLNNLSYGQKIFGLAAITTGLAVALVCSAVIYMEYTQSEQRARQELETNAKLIATHAAASLLFDDVQTGVETLAALQAVKEIRSACIFYKSGERFACYGKDDEKLQTTFANTRHDRIVDGVLQLSHPIIQGETLLGILALRYDMSSVTQQLVKKASIASAVGMLALALSLMLAAMLRRRLTLPVNELVATAKQVSAEDYSVRAHRYADDEFGMLTNAFNHMLTQIEARGKVLGNTQDLLEQQVRALRENRSRLAIAQRMARLGYWTWNSANGEFHISEELASICETDGNEKIESLQQFAQLIFEEDRLEYDADFERTLNERVTLDADYRLETQAGSMLHIHQQLNVESLPDEPVVVVATVQDVTTQKKTEEEIRRLAYYDSLTGLASRRHLYQRLDEMIKSARRRGNGFALFFMDLDGFKYVNDSLGHDQGDILLKTIAGRLTKTLRDNDFLARLGGDEFCMLIEDVTDEMHIGQIANRCLESVEAIVILGAQSVRPQVSIGISRFPAEGDDAHALLRTADSAMYAAKESGKHRFEFFDAAMTLEAGERLALAEELRQALHKEEFELYYQPQIELANCEIVGYEALVRWNHPSNGLVPPNEFIPELERLGLIDDLGTWAINKACEQIAHWREVGVGEVRISVNIAPTQFQSPDLVGVVTKALKNWHIGSGFLELEVTETAIQTAEQTSAVLARLRAIGVSIAIDDFGSGYSSLGSLQHLPIDCLKIDRIFIKDLLNNPKDAVLLGTIMTLAHALGFIVVAEGVEEQNQIQVLRGLDCDIVQGFYFSKPIPASAIPELHERGFFPETPTVDKLRAT